jgi:hypothetical protein
LSDHSNHELARERLRNEIVSLRDAWNQYSYLFGEDARRVQVLNACAGWFFGLVQRVLFREVILAISRLTDPPNLGDKENLAIDVLLADERVDNYAGLRARLEKAIADSRIASQDVRIHRNKYIAHMDRATALGSPEAPLPELKRASIEAAISALESAYNDHAGHVSGVHHFFDVSSTRGAAALIRSLEGSDKWRNWQELQRGEEPVREPPAT